jgi:ribonuclease HI
MDTFTQEAVATNMTKSTNIVFTDGACSGNPGPGGWGSIILRDQNVTELGGFDAETTNNRMELLAAIEAIEFLTPSSHPTKLYTDSSYLVNGISKWIFGWKQRGFKTSTGDEVKNKDLWMRLDKAQASHGGRIEFIHVAAHVGIPANERCDQIAVEYSKELSPRLYTGPASEYSVDLSITEASSPKTASKKSKNSSKKAYSYLSYVDGKLVRHKTWPACEALVKGRSGVKFKKSISPEDEIDIIKSWGLNPNDLKNG